jgi:hypothetical protein
MDAIPGISFYKVRKVLNVRQIKIIREILPVLVNCEIPKGPASIDLLRTKWAVKSAGTFFNCHD